jgi:hypothetical protein
MSEGGSLLREREAEPSASAHSLTASGVVHEMKHVTQDTRSDFMRTF